jgi:L-arabinose isomerase
MVTIRKARVGLIGLIFDLYDRWPDLKPQVASFAQELADAFSSFGEIDYQVVSSRAEVERVVDKFEAEDRDLIMVVLLTYTPSHVALSALMRTRLPILILNTQQLYAVTQNTVGFDTSKNHGMHGVQDLANVLLRSGREFKLITGHYKDKSTVSEIKSWCDAARMVRFLRHMRLGLVGYPMEGMGDFGLDETAFLTQVGAEIRRISMKELADCARAAPEAEVARQMAQDRELFRFQEDITELEHEASSRLEWALRETLRSRSMNGFSAHFLAVSEEGMLQTLPFFASSKLLAEGFGFGGEGDMTSAAIVSMMHELTGASNFTEMFTMDFANNSILMMHMGEANWMMARKDEPIWVLRSTLGLADTPVAPLLLAFSLEPGDATLVNLTTVANGRLRLLVAEGRVADFPYIPAMERPHYKFTPAEELSKFLTEYSLLGGSHHLALSYGRWSNEVKKIGELLGIECLQV